MKGIKRFKKGIILFLAVCCVAGACAGIATARSGVMAESALTEVQVATTYELNSSFSIPEAKITYNGKSYNTMATLVYPNGEVRSSDECILDMSGVYTVRYRAIADDGKILEEEKSFTVYQELFSVSGKDSSAYYGKHSVYAQDKEGIVVSLANGDTFTYNVPVDISNCQRAQDLVSFFPTPKQVGIADVGFIYVRLTDLYDENNFVEVRLHASSRGEPGTYTLARRNGEAFIGLSKLGANKTSGLASRWIEYEDASYQVYNDGQVYGTILMYPWNSDFVKYSNARPGYNATSIGDKTLSLSYDYSTNRIYGYPIPSEKAGFIVDLDDPEFYQSEWKGFTTGEVLVSFYAADYFQDTFNFVIEDIVGQDLKTGQSNTDADIMINVDVGEVVPYGIVNVPYKIFDAEVLTPIIAASDYTCRVYKNYDSGKRISIDIQDGYFVPSSAGIYTIEYSVKDSSNRITKERVDIEVLAATSLGMQIALEEDVASSANIFSKVRVADFSILNNSGDYSIAISAISPTGVVYSIEENDLSFIPLETGIYTIEYQVTDYISSKKKQYALTINATDTPVILDESNLDRYLLKNAYYRFPALYAHCTENGKDQVKETKIYAIADCAHSSVQVCDCTRVLVEDKYQVKAEQSLAVIYVAEANGKSTEKRYDIPVVDTNYAAGAVNFSAYFDATSGVEYNNSAYVGETIPEDSKAKLSYINALGTWNFELVFETVQNYENYSQVEIVLTSEDDLSKSVVLSLCKDGAEKTRIRVGKNEDVLPIALSNGSTFTIKYDTTAQAFVINDCLVKIFEYENGEKFDGFNSQKVLLDIEIKGITGKYALKMRRLCGQALSGTKYDGVAPSISFDRESIENIRVLPNQKFTVPAFYVADVLDPVARMSVSMIDADGQFVRADDGTLLDGTQDYSKEYIVTAQSYGVYTLKWDAEDYSENWTDVMQLRVYVVDTEQPNVSLGAAPIVAKVGDQVSIAAPTITDNLSTNCSLAIYVLGPDGRISTAGINNLFFTASVKGTYTVMYYVYDEAMNLTIVKYLVSVS